MEQRVDISAAAASWTWTSGVTSAGAIITAPQDLSIWLWLIGTIITALLSTASALFVGLAVAWFKDRLEARRRDRERAFVTARSGEDSVDKS